MTIKEYKTVFIERLNSVYDFEEAERFFYLVLEHQFQWKRIDLALHPTAEMPEAQILIWEPIIRSLMQQVPIQYLLGSTGFYGLNIEVDPQVLIPRPETEELVEWVIKSCSPGSVGPPKILDIGTGSGCIAIALAKELPHSLVTAMDVSEGALEVARRNAKKNEVTVNFIKEDVLTLSELQGQYDCIVSNPPYVRHLEQAEIKKNVLDYEPHLALFVSDEDPLLFYRKIAQLAWKSLGKNGLLFFEINQYLGNEMIALLEEIGFEKVLLRKDLFGNDRMICAAK